MKKTIGILLVSILVVWLVYLFLYPMQDNHNSVANYIQKKEDFSYVSVLKKSTIGSGGFVVFQYQEKGQTNYQLGKMSLTKLGSRYKSKELHINSNFFETNILVIKGKYYRVIAGSNEFQMINSIEAKEGAELKTYTVSKGEQYPIWIYQIRESDMRNVIELRFLDAKGQDITYYVDEKTKEYQN